MKVTGFDGAEGSGFFHRFAFGSLAVRQARVGRAFGESPLVAAVGINQKELDGGAAPAITNRGYLQRQRLRSAG